MDSRSLPLFYELVRVIECYRNVPNVEIELRLGWIQNHRFSTNIGASYFQQIINRLEHSDLEQSHETSDVYIQGILRKIVNPKKNTTIQKKKRLETIDFSAHGTPYDIRVSVCQEIPVRPKNTNDDTWSFLRNRKRSSFRYKMWNYDLSECNLNAPVDEYSEDTLSYEVELELDTSDIQNLSSSYLAHSAVVKILELVCMDQHEKINLKTIDLTSRNKQRAPTLQPTRT